MSLNNSGKIFPRELTDSEKQILFAILPADKKGYASYRKKIDDLQVISYGRFGGTNLILGNENDIPDFSFSSSPIFAIGTLTTNHGKIDVLIHEEEDGMIEFDISGLNEIGPVQKLIIEKCDTYSEWKPGDKSPYDNLPVREILIIKNKFLLAISSSQKKLWLHDINAGLNHLIPLTNFFNELMRVKNIRDPEIALKPNLFFRMIDKFTDNDLRMALFKYDKYLNKFNLPRETTGMKTLKHKRKLFKFFSRGSN